LWFWFWFDLWFWLWFDLWFRLWFDLWLWLWHNLHQSVHDLKFPHCADLSHDIHSASERKFVEQFGAGFVILENGL
jgi:hypothetical protein